MTLTTPHTPLPNVCLHHAGITALHGNAEALEDRQRMQDYQDGLYEPGDLKGCQFEEFEGRAY